MGDNATLESSLISGGGVDTVTLGDNLLVHGTINLGNGNNHLTIGDEGVVESQILTGSGSDSITVGDNVLVKGGLNAGGGGDTLTGGYFTPGNWQGIKGGDHPDGGGDTLLLNWAAAGVSDEELVQILTDAGWTHDPLTGLWSGGSPFYVKGVRYEEWESIGSAPCFTRGTLIETAAGPVPVEALRVGDLVVTRDHGLQPIRWAGKRRLDAARLAAEPKLRPIRIRAGALGRDLPAQDLLVSPQHRILLRSKIAQRMFGCAEVLVAAKQLLAIDGIAVETEAREIDYHHIMFDRHEIVISNGAETESLFTGPEALKSVGAAACAEIFALFPELRTPGTLPQPARPLPAGKLARQLVARHARNGKALVGEAAH